MVYLILRDFSVGSGSYQRISNRVKIMSIYTPMATHISLSQGLDQLVRRCVPSVATVNGMRELSLFFLLSLLLSSFLCSEAKTRREKLVPPVVLIPGDGGSQIEAKLDKPSTVHYICSKKTDGWFDLWLNMELLVPFVIDCWVDNMKLVYDNVTRKTSNTPGVITRIPGFGNSSTVEWLDPSHRSPTGYFKDIVNALVPLGYERGVNVRGAPFDFRKAPNEHSEYFRDLRRLIEETYQASGQKVILILHSMGGPMTHYFLNQQPQHWKDKHIETVVSLAGAWGGSIKAVKVYTAGDNLGIYVISSLKVRDEQRSAPSLAFLLPSADLWGPDDILVQTPTKNYSTANFEDLFEELNLPDAYQMYLDTKDLLRNPPPPGVDVHCLHGEGVQTVEKLVYASGKFPDSPTVLYGDGDGTVNFKSATRCLQWIGKQKKDVHHKTFKGVDHMQILRDTGVVNYVVELVQNITKKNAKRAQLKNDNLIRLSKNRNQPSNHVLKTENFQKNNYLLPRIWFDDLSIDKEKNEKTIEVNRIHPNSIRSLQDEGQVSSES